MSTAEGFAHIVSLTLSVLWGQVCCSVIPLILQGRKPRVREVSQKSEAERKEERGRGRGSMVGEKEEG